MFPVHRPDHQPARQRDPFHRAAGQHDRNPEHHLPGQPVCPAGSQQRQPHHRQRVPGQERCGCCGCLRADFGVRCRAFPPHWRLVRRCHGNRCFAARYVCCVRRLCSAAHSLNGNFIAAMLTILGYSINDTVVIYDRIRENTGLYGKRCPCRSWSTCPSTRALAVP